MRRRRRTRAGSRRRGAVRVPAEQDGGGERAATASGSRSPRGEPRDRDGATRPRRESPTAGGRPRARSADRERVRRRAPGARDPERPGEREHPAASRTTFSPTREQVIEPRAAEARLQPVREPGVVAEHDAGDDRPPLSRQARRRGTAEPGAQTVCRPGKPGSSSKLVPLVDLQHDVDALATEPRSLVEAVADPRGLLQRGQQAEDRRPAAGRGRAAARAGRARRRRRPSKRCRRADARCSKRPRPRLGGEDDDEPTGAAGVGGERAAVERARRAPCPTTSREAAVTARVRAGPDAASSAERGCDERQRDARSTTDARRRSGQRRRRRARHAAAASEHVCRKQAAHGTTGPSEVGDAAPARCRGSRRAPRRR